MKRSLATIILLFAFVTGLIGACTPVTPPCDPAALVEPEMGPPYRGEIVDVQPTLSWNYPDTGCQPDGYQIEIARDEAFTDMILTDNVGGGASSWGSPSPLEPGTRYYWRARAIADGTAGPGFDNYFMTGPICAPAELQPPFLIAPADGARHDPATQALFFDFPAGVCASQGVLIQIAEDTSFAAPMLDLALPLPFLGVRPNWTWTECQTYYWRTMSIADDGTRSAPSAVWSFIADSTGACDQTPLTFTTTQSANCRSGPDTVYPVVTSFVAGQTLPIIGRNLDGTWFFVQTPDGQQCWISANTGQTSGDTTRALVAQIPPTPTPIYIVVTDTPQAGFTPPTNCGDFKSFVTCKAPCRWQPTNQCMGCGYCTYP